MLKWIYIINIIIELSMIRNEYMLKLCLNVTVWAISGTVCKENK